MMMKNHITCYLDHLRSMGKDSLASAVAQTVDEIVPKYIRTFNYSEHVVSLLIGDVQSGKTSHMFGLMCAAADEGFGCFILLTTDNVILQQQTLQRASKDLPGFCICGENDYIKFAQNGLRMPTVIVLKKNGSVLRKWKNNLASSKLLTGNPLFIVDDEADAASLNTQVNQNKVSRINSYLSQIKKIASGSIYLEVTGTPQAILLQSNQSGWKPLFISHFRPGKEYLGGNFFFSDANSPHIVLTNEEEASDLLCDDEYPENGLKSALVVFLITSAHIKLNGGAVCNFLIHPSYKIKDHDIFAGKVGAYLNEIYANIDSSVTQTLFLEHYNKLKETKKNIASFEDIYAVLKDELTGDKINIYVLNSDALATNIDYEQGCNILVGGNSLGRGVTFPMLQTIYYCRLSKKPQADTMWQHSRMFGYNRDPELVRVFMPPMLFKLFSEINAANNSIVAQVSKGTNCEDVKLRYSKGISPTRKNVLDKKAVIAVSGGVNYFPFFPINHDLDKLDELLSPFGNEPYNVSLKFISKILDFVDSDGSDWNAESFQNIVNSYSAENSLAQGILIVRRGRSISRGTGTLLSPNDRILSDSFTDNIVLILYKVTGEKGWDGKQIWIPNIKFPDGTFYYGTED